MSQGPEWIALPITKFSHNSSPVGTRNFIWNHTSARNDLDFVIRNVRVIDDHGNYSNRIFMKITAGTETLESQDLGDLITFSRAQDSTVGSEQPVQVVIRTPFLAMRYPKSANEVRRIQVKFNGDQQFTQAWSALRDLGLPVTESAAPGGAPNPKHISRLPLTSSPALSAFSSVSAASSTTTVASALPLPICYIETSRLDSISAPPMHKIQSHTEFKIPMRPESVPSEERRTVPLSANSSSRPSPTNFTRTPSLPTVSSFPEAMTQMPSIYVSQLEREMQSRQHSIPRSQPTNRMLTQSPFFASQDPLAQASQSAAQETPSFSFQDTNNPTLSRAMSSGYRSLQASLHNTPDAQSFPNTGRMQRATLVPLQDSLSHHRSTSPEFEHSPRHTPFPQPSQRHSSAMEFYDKMLSDALPPKRVLPFERSPDRPRAASVSALRAVPQPLLIERAASAIQPKTAASKSAAAPSSNPAPKKRVAQRKPSCAAKVVEKELPTTGTELQELNDESPAQIDNGATRRVSGALPDEQSPLAAKSAATSSRLTVAAAGLLSKSAEPQKRSAPAWPGSATKRAKMVDQGTQTQTLSGRDHTTAMASSRLPSVLATPTQVSFVPPPSVRPPETYLDMIDNCISKLKSRPAPEELYQAPGYATSTEEDRQRLINEFICKSLEDVEFLQLVEDMGKSWRRHGLGL